MGGSERKTLEGSGVVLFIKESKPLSTVFSIHLLSSSFSVYTSVWGKRDQMKGCCVCLLTNIEGVDGERCCCEINYGVLQWGGVWRWCVCVVVEGFCVALVLMLCGVAMRRRGGSRGSQVTLTYHHTTPHYTRQPPTHWPSPPLCVLFQFGGIKQGKFWLTRRGSFA